MQFEATIDEEKLGSEYLITVQSLGEELASATAAIARNDIEALESHIASQQKLCDQLLSLNKLGHPLRVDSAAWSSVAGALQTLLRNNQVYSKLLATSGRAHQLLLTLCRAYKDSSKHVAEQDSNTQALSCEV
jgi:hypothetical protein